MGKKQKPAPKASTAPPGTVLGNLLQAHGFAAREKAAEAGEAGLDLSQIGKLVVRRERKGHGGKTVTLISGLPAPRLDLLARALRKGLGCGATVENGIIVLQGDIPERAQSWLASHGARQIVLGN